MPVAAPNLKESVERLKHIDKNLLDTSPKDIAEVYVAAIGLLTLLKKDQGTLHKCREESTNEETPRCPPPEETPAITAVLGDAKLFGVLLNCLKGTASNDAMGSGENPRENVNLQSGRKRSLSVTTDTPISNKAMRMSHTSPVPSRKGSISIDMRTQIKPALKLPVLAATILSIAFAHADHWPVPLVEAYAADCFGSRTWVDEPSCGLLVKNLQLMHHPADESTVSLGENDPELFGNAAKVAAAYRNFQISEGVTQAVANSNNKQVPAFQARRPSLGLSSVGSGLERMPMERTFSTESVDPAVRAQIPYEMDGDSVMDDDDQVELMVSATPSNLSVKKKKRRESGSSSSSGGDDELVVAQSESNDGDSEDAASVNKKAKESGSATKRSANGSLAKRLRRSDDALYPLQQTALNLSMVRQRYFGENLELAYEAVHQALLDRIDQKTRQNSGLLQALPQFTAVPLVRCLVAENLAKWLQSPALAGLARKLFAEMVDKMKNVDPPLKEDLKAIDCILSMKLKANQFAAHMENLTAVAARIPTPSVAQHIFISLMRDLLVPDSAQGVTGDLIKMIGGVHKALPRNVSYDAMAASLLTLLVESDTKAQADKKEIKSEKERIVIKLRNVVRTLAASLGGSFDPSQLMDALLSLDVDNENWSVRNEEDKARLMFQCVTLHVAAASLGSSRATKGLDETQKREVTRKLLHKARKSLLTWCCTDYGPRWSLGRKKKTTNESKGGAGAPNYRSAIGPIAEQESIPTWLNTMRCLLFIEEANSELMGRFLAPSQTTVEDSKGDMEEEERIKACCAYGADIDDEMIRVVLNAFSPQVGKLPAEMALQLLEHLFESCGRARGTALRVSDPELVWELYELAQYSPPADLLAGKEPESPKLKEKIAACGDDGDNFPRIALPGFWWRVTMLGLVMCGAAPTKIGEVVWKEHPTLRALMKMVISARYRFPTVDCDDASKESMKLHESEARETETQIAEFLFLPPKRKKDLKNGQASGARVSKRLRKQQEAKEAAAALAETNKRKKMLKSAQKSIMLWDPDGPARKPPRESAELLLSVEKMFGLSASFQRCTGPDFLLLTIGETTRGAIERAYAWLIPVISELPEVISRLPSSASCFLLLRAYGSDSGDKTQLKLLSAPLLSHVKESLRGRYGEEDCIRAFELLMSDVASHNADRRKSARRVLQDAIGTIEGSKDAPSSSSWMLNVILVEHSKSLAQSAINHLSKAATFERGKVLKHIVLALREYLNFAAEHNIERKESFPTLLARLISQRQSVYAEAIDTFPDLRELAVGVVYSEITSVAGSAGQPTEKDRYLYARIWLELMGTKTDALLSLDLLQASCVLLSICSIGEGDSTDRQDAVGDLVQILLRPNDTLDSKNEHTLGLAGATMGDDSGELAVSVESWILLCKARHDVIGKKAALSVPEEFLARLLLSSGLPRSSLIAMLDRLGKLGESSDIRDDTYRKLLLPSASSEWDLGRIGKQRDVVRKLLGRLSAYFRVVSTNESVSAVFLDWLLKESTSLQENATKTKKKKGKNTQPNPGFTLKDAPKLLRGIKGPFKDEQETKPLEDTLEDDLAFLGESSCEKQPPSTLETKSAINHFLSSDNPQGLDFWLTENALADSPDYSQIAVVLLQCVENNSDKDKWMHDCLLKWIPVLTKYDCTVETMMALFSAPLDTPKIPQNVLSSVLDNCLQSWTSETMHNCTNWIISMDEKLLEKSSVQQLVTLLHASLGYQTLTEQESVKVCRIAILCLEKESGNNGIISERNNLPESLLILLHLSDWGKKHFILVGKMILQRIDQIQSTNGRAILGSAFMRLYLLHPEWASTGAAQVRNVLLKSAEENANFWSSWVSSSDDQFDDLLEALASGDSRVVRAFNDQARKYPLLVLRKSQSFVEMLQGDASPSGKNPSPHKVIGVHTNGPTEASMEGHLVRVNIRDWGYEYTDSIWSGVLEIFNSIHKEVLYTSGQKLGLWTILECVLQLLEVQSNLTTAKSAIKMKTKVSEMMNLYRDVNSPGFNNWLCSLSEGVEVRNILVGCGLLSQQDAIESLKATEK